MLKNLTSTTESFDVATLKLNFLSQTFIFSQLHARRHVSIKDKKFSHAFQNVMYNRKINLFSKIGKISAISIHKALLLNI